MKNTLIFFISLLFLASCKNNDKNVPSKIENTVSADSARAIAKEAWIYGFSVFYNYKSQSIYALNKDRAEYAGGFNRFKHYSTSFTASDSTVVTPNNDTPYSWAILDLSDEPMILEVPEIEDDRYYVMQLVDLYTFNFDYIGSRATGNKAGKYLIAGPDWEGSVPEEINKAFTSETNLVTILGRTEMDDPSESALIEEIQKGYKLIPLHEYTQTEPPKNKTYNLPLPVWNEADYTSLEFINVLNALLQYVKVDESEVDLYKRFAKIGLVPGQKFDKSEYSEEVLAGIKAGITDGEKALKENSDKTTSSLHLFGSRKELGNNYLARATAAAMGLFGNTKEEAVYVGTMFDNEGKDLIGSNKYILHFKKEELPTVDFFWSLTMYNLPKRGLVANPIDRYSIGDRTKGLKYEDNGDLIIYLQSESPGKGKESNWLPTPKEGGFNIIVRMYGPGEEITSGNWKMPMPTLVK
ncbi:DUF1254 domain-containing protein [Tamlana sp. 2_MG-2023]|uniref:DUF1254 domain-containing protein n=1 Tax=unclassified Tamlana TaxID=2614803 RepID=UPI0026E232F4|nr:MULTISPECIES: DUF1254 domain-containing protein [unclassified Tamlana]MDO6760402.1 DUF1254 domain-containing protein [Tamlana sp. 2_MG-2023]MDO6789899.1 DUF1254 domain-containing protein [Tamlana sp. 1_MG-2023]